MVMKGTPDVEKLAQLARIRLTDAERLALEKDFKSILAFVGKIAEVDVDMRAEDRLGVPHNVMREDTDPHETGIYTESLLKDAPDTKNGYIKVKKIL